MRKRLVLRTGALALAGAGNAQAFSYGTTSVYHDGSLHGQGYGTFARTGYNDATLRPWLRDTRRDKTKTYTEARAYGNNQAFGVQSGRRPDGASSFARMADRKGYSSGAMVGYRATVKVCQDVPRRPDWCTTSRSGNL
jgi:hypothetical protein